MSKTFIIADLRLFDKERLAEFGFSDFERMNNHIIKMWNRTVSEEDQVILMGVVGCGDFEEMKSVLTSLNGEFIILSKHSNKNFTRKQWRELGVRFFWDVPMFNKLENGKEIIYEISQIKDVSKYKDYALVIVDSANPIEGELPFKENLLSADAMNWGYVPLDTEELIITYENMKEFAAMEMVENKSEIEEF